MSIVTWPISHHCLSESVVVVGSCRLCLAAVRFFQIQRRAQFFKSAISEPLERPSILIDHHE
jgi:hypothetical protein